ncbi:MAG: hypothetical protein ACM3O4_00610 [Ignavibacteriales bacterium]
MKLERELVNITKKIKGSLVCFDVNNNNIIEAIRNNKKINDYYEFTFGGRVAPKMKSSISRKKYNIKKIRKYFKKKSVNYFIGDIRNLKKYFNSFIKNSINLNNDTIYLYGKNSDYEIDELRYRYERYGIKVKVKTDEEHFLLEINVKDAKAKILKNCKYRIRDNIYNLGEYISQILIN